MHKLFLLIGFLLSATANLQAAEADLAELFSAIDERLSHMESVALYKAQNQLPIEDIAREEIVIADAKRAAYLEGINPDSIEAFFMAQISAAKAIQYRYRAELLSAPNPSPAVDLDRTIRPAITELGNRIVILLTNYLKDTGSIKPIDIEQFNLAISTRFISEADKNLLFNALLKARLN